MYRGYAISGLNGKEFVTTQSLEFKKVLKEKVTNYM